MTYIASHTGIFELLKSDVLVLTGGHSIGDCNLLSRHFGILKKPSSKCAIYVVVQFYPWYKVYFLLVLGKIIMAMYDNELKRKENKIFI